MAGTIELSTHSHFQNPNGTERLLVAFNEPISGFYDYQGDGSGSMEIDFLLERYPNPDQVVLYIAKNRELWGPKNYRIARRFEKEGIPMEHSQPKRTIQLNLDGKGSARIDYYNYVIVDLGMDLRPMRYADFPDHAYHLQFLLGSRPNIPRG